MGLILGVFAGIFAIIKGEFIDLLAQEAMLSAVSIANLGVALIILTLSTTIISACSLSLEGKEFWIIKAMPISPKTVLLSKALMQFVICAPVVLVSTVLMLIASSVSPLYYVVYIIAAELVNLAFSFFGILINVAFPKFNYDNEAQVVKQSLSTLVSMLTAMLISTALIVGIFFLTVISDILALLLLVGVPIVMLAIEIPLLIYPASKKYESFVL